jgi:ERCC4-type nuclease
MVTLQNVHITIDNRERGLKALFEQQSNEVYSCIEYKNLDLGDIILSFTWNDNTIQYVFERKTIDDLQASIKDGRYHDQKKRLISTYTSHNVFYIIEGGCTYSDTTDASIKSALVNTILRDGIGIFRTNSMKDTYDLICSIVQRLHDTPEKYATKGGSSATALQPSAIAHYKKESTYINMLCQIPGVSLKTAKAIESVFPTWGDIMKLASETEAEKLKKLKAITTSDTKGNSRKISSATITHIINTLFV